MEQTERQTERDRDMKYTDGYEKRRNKERQTYKEGQTNNKEGETDRTSDRQMVRQRGTDRDR